MPRALGEGFTGNAHEVRVQRFFFAIHVLRVAVAPWTFEPFEHLLHANYFMWVAGAHWILNSKNKKVKYTVSKTPRS